MVVPLVGFIPVFAAGLLAKVADALSDKWKEKAPSPWALFTGLAYGVLYAAIVSFSVAFANLFLGIAIAVLLAGKIDSKPHQYAIAGFLGMLAVIGFPPAAWFNLQILAGVVVFALIDEFSSDYFSNKTSGNGIFKQLLSPIAKNRLFMELFTVVLGLLTGEWEYLFGIVVFDVGYVIAGFLKGGKNG
ncbi:TPA: hypothetical protein HA244_03275 [Candidatus Micrarchaeota archaeon]|nr:hypothetical protein [Candidatus Micrarchaeota archaeon]